MLAFVLLYILAYLLEFSLAVFVEMAMQWFWPTLHILLRAVERTLKGAGSFVREIDEIGSAVYCDMADAWCTQFRLMCNQKCTYTSLALDRMR